MYDWNWLGAETRFQRAIELSPNSASAHRWYGAYLSNLGRREESASEIKRAKALDPLSLETNTMLGYEFYFARQYDLAIEQLRKTIELAPTYWWAHLCLGRAHEQKGEFAEAIEEFQKARLIQVVPENLAVLGHAYAVSGKRAEALKVLTELGGSQSTLLSRRMT